MEYLITAKRPFEEIEAQAIEALQRWGFVVQRTFSLHSATAGACAGRGRGEHGRGVGSDGGGHNGNPGYSVLLLYSSGARRQPSGLVTVYERQGRTVIHALPTENKPPLSPGRKDIAPDGGTDVAPDVAPSVATDVAAELAAALTLGGLDFAIGPGGQPIDPVCGRCVPRGQAQAAIEHEGVVYYVCCPLCQAEFERDPGRYILT